MLRQIEEGDTKGEELLFRRINLKSFCGVSGRADRQK